MAGERLTDSQKQLLWHLMQARFLDQDRLKRILGQCFPDDTTVELDEQVSRLNNALRDLKFAIEKVVSDSDCLTYYVLVNLISNDCTSTTSIENVRNVESFHQVLRSLLTSPSHSLPRLEMELKMAEHVRNQKRTNTMLKAPDVHELVDWWVKHNLLHCSPDGTITIGFVALAEFTLWIQREYPNVAKKCALCQSIVVGGDKCSSCQESLHTSCKARLQRANKCPKCQ